MHRHPAIVAGVVHEHEGLGCALPKPAPLAKMLDGNESR
jgi:hypothetical protein